MTHLIKKEVHHVDQTDTPSYKILVLKAMRIFLVRWMQWKMNKILSASSTAAYSSIKSQNHTYNSALRKKSIPIDSSPVLAQPYLPSSRTFSPVDFLATVHSTSTYPVLASGLSNLQESIQQESGALKQLVTGDFDRFVRCKSGIDEVYERMVEGGLSSKEEYGTKKIKKALDGNSFGD